MSGIFRKKILKKSSFDFSPVISQQIEEKKVSKNGVSTTYVDVVDKDMMVFVDMPTKEEFDLEEQLKVGIMPQAVNVKGILPNENGVYSAVEAFNSLQSQIDKLNETDKVSE